MAKNRTGNNKFLKELNQTSVLDLIRVNKALSRAELSQLTGLSATATGMIVSGLLEKGYIHEVGIGESTGGRRPVLLELNPGSFYSVGVDVDVNYINLVLIDITGKIISEISVDSPENTDYTVVIDQMAVQIKNMLESCCIGLEKLLGIGVSVPGMVDSETHKVVFAPNLLWQDVDVAACLARHLDTHVYVENEAMASAICEHWLGLCQGVNNFVCINVRSGIGAGIFTGGKPYRGAGGSAGEVGHIVVDENGPKCGCGNYGCLETIASTSHIVEKAKRLVRQGIVSSLNNCEEIENIDIDTIVNAARLGDDASRSVLLEAARYMGIAISSIVNTLNPSNIVIGKEFVKYADMVMEQICSIVSSKALKNAAYKVKITSSGIGEKASTLGAAIVPLKVLFGK